MMTNLLNLAMQSIRRNMGRYQGYFLSNIVFIMIYFLNETLRFHPWFTRYFADKQTFSQIGYINLLFFLVFLISSLGFLLQTKKQEIALYVLHGATPIQISFILFIENMIIGLLAIIIGILLGLALNKFFFILVSPLIGVPVFPFSLSLAAITWTAAIYGIIFLLNACLALFFIYTNKVDRLLKVNHIQQKQIIAVLWFFLGFSLFIAMGYIYRYESNILQDNKYLVAYVVGAIVGGYLCLAHFSSIFLYWMERNPILHPISMLWSGRLRFQTKTHFFTFFLAIAFFVLSINSTESLMSFIRQPNSSGAYIVASLFDAVICFFAGTSFLYFRNYAQLEEDRRQYGILSKLGFSTQEMYRLATLQMSYLFFVPFAFATLESLVFSFDELGYILFDIGINLGGLFLYFFLVRTFYLKKIINL